MFLTVDSLYFKFLIGLSFLTLKWVKDQASIKQGLNKDHTNMFMTKLKGLSF